MRYRKRSSQVLSGLDNWREDKNIALATPQSPGGYDVCTSDEHAGDFRCCPVLLVAFSQSLDFIGILIKTDLPSREIDKER